MLPINRINFTLLAMGQMDRKVAKTRNKSKYTISVYSKGYKLD